VTCPGAFRTHTAATIEKGRDFDCSMGDAMNIDFHTLPPTVCEDLAALESERSRYLAAACRASEVYPGALGELVHRELVAFAEFGYRMAGHGSVQRLAAEVLDEVQDVVTSARVHTPGSGR
jgi:hypothetical protein